MGPCVIFDYFLIGGPTWVFPSVAVKLHMGSSDYYGKNLCHYVSNQASEIVYVRGKWVAQSLAVLVFRRRSVDPAEWLVEWWPKGRIIMAGKDQSR